MAASPTTSAAQRLALQPVVTSLVEPVYVTHARDGSGRLFVLEQPGRIKVLAPGATEPTVFLDITSRVLAGGERGLLGLAFHPQFSTNRRFFVKYTRPGDGANVVAEYRVLPGNPNAADPSSEIVFLVIPQPFSNHNAGMVEFGPDGFLYISTGDGGAGDDPGNRAQNITQLLGKMLRIDVDTPNGQVPYSSPPSNPFFGAVPGLDEIFAYGLRNPFRFSFDRGTGDLYVGDVGQSAREEIDIITLGGNYGWRIWEGTSCTGNDPGLCNPAGFIFPIAEYGHTGGRCSVTGGYAYRGNTGTLPAGAYVFGDFCTGEIFLLEGGAQSLLLATDLPISSFGEDQAGELYVVGIGGTVHRLVNLDAPALSLALNQSVVRAGDTLRVSLAMRNGQAPVTADEYFGIVHPDGTTVTFLTRLTPPAGSTASLAADARTFAPLVPALVLPAGTDATLADFFTFTLTGAETPGSYVVFAALARPGHLADGRVDPGDLLAVAQTTVVVTP